MHPTTPWSEIPRCASQQIWPPIGSLGSKSVIAVMLFAARPLFPHEQTFAGTHRTAVSCQKRSLPPFAERELRNVYVGSVRLDADGLDHFGPLLGFLGDEPAKVCGQARKRRAAQAGKLRLELGVGEARVNFLVELVNNLRRCGLGRADAIPLARLEARQEFSHSWDARQRLRARCARYR